MLERQILTPLLDAVVDAAKAATKAIEAIRAAAARESDPLELWSVFDKQIGAAEKEDARQDLIDLRSRFETEWGTREIDRIARAFGQSSEDGWREWITLIARVVAVFRLRFGIRLSSHDFPFPADRVANAAEIKTAVSRMLEGRWVGAYDQIEYLAEATFVPPVTRARLLVMIAEIDRYHLGSVDRAKGRLDSAEALAANDGRVLGAIGDYWLSQKQNDKAEACFNRAIHADPGQAYGYVGMGDVFESRTDLDAAEVWYRKAVAAAAGDSMGYRSILKLIGRPERFATREGELGPLIQNVIAVAPEDDYEVYLVAGNVYKQHERYDQAHQWYGRATVLYPTRPGGYRDVGSCLEDEGRFGEAESAYKKAIEVAPESYDGYWGLTWFYEKQEKWESALHWYSQVPLHRNDWKGLVRVRIGEMLRRLSRLTEAEQMLWDALRDDKSNNEAKYELHNLADQLSQKNGDADGAKRIYRELLAILGDTYQGDYHNRTGNLYFDLGDYAPAAEHYRHAIAANPDNAAFHRNLASAYTRLKDYSQAAAELDRAFQLDKDEAVFRKEKAVLTNARGNDFYVRGEYQSAIELYAEAVNDYEHDDVIYANLGSAWENLKEPGNRARALENALGAFKKAQSIKPTEKNSREIARLEHKRTALSRYGEQVLDLVHAVTPIEVEVASNLIRFVEGASQGSLAEDLSRCLTDLRHRAREDIGIELPGIRFRGNEADFPDGTYVIMIAEIPVVSGTVAQDQRFFPGPEEALSSRGLAGAAATNPLTGDGGFWVNEKDWTAVEEAGLELWGIGEYLVCHLEAVLRRNLIEFLGHQEVADLLEREFSAKGPDLAPEKLTALTSVLRGLVIEGVPVKPFQEICDVFDRLYAEGAGLQTIVETIRSELLRSRLPGNEVESTRLPLGPRFEASLRTAIYQKPPHALLAMMPEFCQDALGTVRAGVGDTRRVALVVNDAALRPFVRALTELEFLQMPVLSREEVTTGLEVDAGAVIEIADEPLHEGVDFKWPRLDTPTGGDGNRAPQPTGITIVVYVNDQFLAEKARADEQALNGLLSIMRDGLFYELGIVLPEIRVVPDETLKTSEFRFGLLERDYMRMAGLEPDEYLVNDTVERLALLKIQGRKSLNPANGSECTIVREAQTSSETCRGAGLTTWGPAGLIILTLSSEIRKVAPLFQTTDATEYILASLSAAFPQLIDAARNRFPVKQISLVLRDLLEEEISIRDLRSILESMLSINGTTDVDLSRFIVFAPVTQNLCPVNGHRGLNELTTSDYSSFVRKSLKRYISHKYTRGSRTLIVYLLDPTIEDRLRNAATQPLTSDEDTRLKDAIREEMAGLGPMVEKPVLLTTMDIRKYVRNLLRSAFPNLAVLSYDELSADTNIQPLARISWH